MRGIRELSERCRGQGSDGRRMMIDVPRCHAWILFCIFRCLYSLSLNILYTIYILYIMKFRIRGEISDFGEMLDFGEIWEFWNVIFCGQDSYGQRIMIDVRPSKMHAWILFWRSNKSYFSDVEIFTFNEERIIVLIEYVFDGHPILNSI